MAERMHVLRGPLTSIGPAQSANPTLSDAEDGWIGPRNAPKSFMSTLKCTEIMHNENAHAPKSFISMLIRTPEPATPSSVRSPSAEGLPPPAAVLYRTPAPVPGKGIDGAVGALFLFEKEGEKSSGRGQGASWRSLETDSDDSLLALDAILHSSLDHKGPDAGERQREREDTVTETHPAQISPARERAPKTGRERQSERDHSPTLEMCLADVSGMSELVEGIADRYQRREVGDREKGFAGDLQCGPCPPVLNISPWRKGGERLWEQKLQNSGGVPHAGILTHKPTQSLRGDSLSPDSRRSRPLNSSSPASAGSDDSFRNLHPSPPAVYQVGKLSAHRPHERNSVLLREQRQGGGSGGVGSGHGDGGGSSAGGNGGDGRGGRATDSKSSPERSLWGILEKDAQAAGGRGRGGAVSAEEWEKHKAGIAGGTRRAPHNGEAAHGQHVKGQSDVSEYISWFSERERQRERFSGTIERETESINDTEKERVHFIRNERERDRVHCQLQNGVVSDTYSLLAPGATGVSRKDAEGKTAKRPSTHSSVTSSLPEVKPFIRKTGERKEADRTSTHSLLSPEVLRKTVKRPEAERTSILGLLRTERKTTDGMSILSGVLKTIQVRL